MSTIFTSGVSSLSKSGSATLTGDVTLSQGTGITLTQSGQDISIAGSALAIGETVTSGTAGSILFVDTGPVLAQANATLFYDKTNKRFGAGTATPGATIESMCTASTEIGLIVQGAASQSANLSEWQDSSSNILLKVTSSGFIGYLASNQTQSTAFNVFDSSSTQTISADIGFALFNCGDTFKFTVSQGAFSLQQFFRHVATYKNDTSLTGTFVANHWSYINQPTFTADTNSTTVCQFNGSAYRDSAIFNRVNSGTMTVGEWNSFQSIPSSATGITITNRRGMIITDCTGGTITNHYGLVINDLANAGSTTTQSLRILGTTGHSRHVPKIKIGADSAPNVDVDVNGWINYAGTSRVSTQFDKTTNTTLANITGLTSTLVAGRTYAFKARLFIDSSAVGGYKLAIAGTATATAIIYNINVLNNATNAFTITSRQTALAGSAGAAVGTSEYGEINGLITVNAGGTLTVQFAQNASNGTSSVLVGSTLEVWDIV